MAGYGLAADPQKENPLSANAQSQLGNVLFERGRLQRSLGEQREGTEREKYMSAARDFFAQSEAVWTAVDSRAEVELKKIVFVRGEDIKRSEARDEIHRRQIEARLARAWVQYEKGLTYPLASSGRATALQEAGRQFDTIYDQQRELLAGFYARLGRGLCCKELGDAEKAFAIFEELLGLLPDDPADFHALRGKAAMQALEIALLSEVKKYKQGLDIAQRWIAGQGAVGAPGDVDLAIRFLGAEAARNYVNTLPPPSAEQAEVRARQIDWIRQQYAVVAAAAGPYQATAKVRLLDPALGGAPAGDAGTFAEARNRAKAALDRMLAAEAQQKAAQRSGIGGDADSQRQRQQQIDSARGEAMKYCNQAIERRTAAVAGEDYDTVRYYQAYLHYSGGEFEEAATIAEALAKSSSDSPAAREAARIGLAAREALFRTARGDRRSVARQQLQDLAEKIIQRWAAFAEADDARAVLSDLALADGRLDEAEDYLRQISDASPRRGEAELAVGQALWGKTRQLLRISTLEHDRTAEADKLIARAAEMLSDGIARCRKQIEAGAAAPTSLAGATLALARIELARGRPAAAIVLLEDHDPRPAPASGYPPGAPGAPALADDSYSLALLAYIAAGQLDKARTCMQTLQASLPPQGPAESARRMLEACVRFQHCLQQHVARYRDRRMDEVLNQTIAQCDKFLAAPADGPAAESFFVLAWRAEALAGMAAGLDGGGPAVSPNAEKRYRQAIAAFQDVLHRVEAGPNFSPAAEVVVALRIDLARCLRRMSDNPQALSQLLVVLKDHPRMVDAQVEAAYTYQSWGDESPEYLEMAIQGGGGREEVWGWGELARRVQPEARFRDVFHEARYNLALCRFRQAQMAAERSERSRLAKAAENDVLATRRLVPDMGGAVWYDKYNELFKRIQRLADRPAAGLPNP